MKTPKITFGIALLSLLLISNHAFSGIKVLKNGQKLKLKQIEIVNNTHYGDLVIAKGERLVIDQNEHLIIDGDLTLEPRSGLTLAEGSNLIVTGTITAEKAVKAKVEGFLLAKENMNLKRKAQFNGHGQVKVEEAVHLEKNAVLFNEKNCAAGPKFFSGSIENDIAVTDTNNVKAGSNSNIEFDKELVAFQNQKMPIDTEPLPIALENQKKFDIEYETNENNDAIYLRLKNPQKDMYKISLNDSTGKILKRKMAVVEESTIEHEEELISGLQLAQGNYYIKINSSEEQFVLPFTVK